MELATSKIFSGLSYIAHQTVLHAAINTILATSYIYREASTPCLCDLSLCMSQAAMVPQHTVSSNLNTPVSANPRQSLIAC